MAKKKIFVFSMKEAFLVSDTNIPSKIVLFFSSMKMAGATLTSRVLGLLREQATAFVFGASGYTDIFFVAYRIPNLLRDLIAEGAFSAAFVPAFTKAQQAGKDSAQRLFWEVFFLLLGFTTLITLIMMIFAPELINLFAPSFKKDPIRYQMAIQMTRLMSPYLIVVTLAALFLGALNSLKMFFLPALNPALFNITMTLSILCLPTWLVAQGIPALFSMGIGVVVGGVIQLVYQVPLFYKKGFRFAWPKKFLTAAAKDIFKKLGPGFIGFAATQVNLIVNTVLATGAALGAVSWLSYAFRLFQFPVGILGVSVANSHLVYFSDKWNEGKIVEAKDVLKSSYELIMSLLFPATALCLALSLPAVNIVFERGQFTAVDTFKTAMGLKYYALGLPFYGLYKLCVPTFYTLDQQKIPVYCSMGSILFNIIFCVFMVDHWGFAILALGTSLAMFLNTTIQCWLMSRKLSLSWQFFASKKVIKVLIASLNCYFVGNILTQFFYPMEAKFFVRSIYFLFIVTSACAAHAATLVLFGEGKEIIRFLKRGN